MHFTEEYEAFNPIMRRLFEKRVHDFISRDNDTILAALQGGVRWHRKRKAREISRVIVLFVYGTLAPGELSWSLLAPYVVATA